jgi:phosphatidylserine/phosphatidylglycerophosphate/cardiolipin synthase-like enzyme
MELMVQPEDGIKPILDAIEGAKRTIDMHIFRLDRKVIEKALAAAVKRGVVVRTLIAHTANNAEAPCASWSSGCWRSAPPSRAARTTWCAITAR